MRYPPFDEHRVRVRVLLAIGVPRADGVPPVDSFAWTNPRPACVLALLRAGRFTDAWLTQIDKVDQHGAEIRAGPKRDEFMIIAQALLSLRLRGMGQGRGPVREMLDAGGIKVSNEDLGEVLGPVRDELNLLL